MLFNDHHEYFEEVAHNMAILFFIFILKYIIDQSMRSDKIIYNGSKSMSMTLEVLHMKVIDSINCLLMKLSVLSKAIG